MSNRYDNRRLITNDLEEYSHVFEERNVNYIRQYASGQLHYPTAAQISTLNSIQRVWSVGDKYYKLAAQYYGDPRYWWVIAHYNKKPTEADVKLGDLIYIPTPLEKTLGYILEG